MHPHPLFSLSPLLLPHGVPKYEDQAARIFMQRGVRHGERIRRIFKPQRELEPMAEPKTTFLIPKMLVSQNSQNSLSELRRCIGGTKSCSIMFDTNCYTQNIWFRFATGLECGPFAPTNINQPWVVSNWPLIGKRQMAPLVDGSRLTFG